MNCTCCNCRHELGAFHTPEQWLRETIAGGEYSVAIDESDESDGSALRRLRSPDDVDGLYGFGMRPPVVMLYRPHEVFVDVEAIPELEGHLDLSSRVAFEGFPEVIAFQLSDSEQDPLQLVEEVLRRSGRPLRSPGYSFGSTNELGLDPISLVHGFRYWSHVHLFSHVQLFSHVHLFDDLPVPDHKIRRPRPRHTLLPPPCNLPATPPSIGLIDTGADDRHSWLCPDLVDATPPIDPLDWPNGHGTVIAGILRQGVPTSQIKVERVKFDKHEIAEEKAVLRAINRLADCDYLSMSFGGETFGHTIALEARLQAYQAAGGTAVAAAGNLEDDGGTHSGSHGHPGDPLGGRRPFAPASFASVIGVAGGPTPWWRPLPTPVDPGTSGAYYAWSNGGNWVDAIVGINGNADRQQWIFSSYPTSKAASGPGRLDDFCASQGTSVLVPLVVAAMAAGAVNPTTDNAQTRDQV